MPLWLTQTYEYFTRFKIVRLSVDDDERSGQHSKGTTTENVLSWKTEGEQFSMFVVCSVSANSVACAEHATHCSDICVHAWLPGYRPHCSTVTNRNSALPSAPSSRNRPKMTPTTSPPLLLVMNLGFTDTTVRRQIHRDPRQHKFETDKIILICLCGTEDIVY
jgi:hypothetical protein